MTEPTTVPALADGDPEVVLAELVDDESLPAVHRAAPQRAAVDQHTILRPGQAVPTEADSPTYTRADFEVSAATAELLDEHSQARNTHRNYSSQRAAFARWCEEMGRVAYPCTTATYVEWVAGLIARGMAPNTIGTYMSGVRSWMPEDRKPGTRQARGLLTEYRKRWSKGNRVKKAPPITDDMLRAMVATCDLRHPIGIRDRCALLVGRGALNRRIEIADLSLADVEVEDAGVSLWIAFSKTDQQGRGESTFVPADPADPELDPVAATRAWIGMLYRLGAREGAFLRALTVRGTLQSRATATERGDHVSGDAVNDWVRGRARAAGLPNWQDITAHGLRRGGAQAIADAGGDPTAQGRWKAGSVVVRREYLDRAQSRAENPWLKVQESRRRGAGG